MRRDHYHEEIGSEILIIGGAEDKLNERHILRKFVDISGGRNASLLIVPVPSDFPLVTATLYKGLFENLGINKITITEYLQHILFIILTVLNVLIIYYLSVVLYFPSFSFVYNF